MIEASIFDFHGTLVDVSPVLPLIAERDYDGFYAGSLSCLPILPTVREARYSREAGNVNLLLTGMPEKYRDGLTDWLTRYEVPVDYILMREPKDRFTKDFIVKRRMYEQLVDMGYYVVRAWEDSPGVIDLWKKLGIDVIEMPRIYLDGKSVRVDNVETVS
jgi:hypothetical protein